VRRGRRWFLLLAVAVAGCGRVATERPPAAAPRYLVGAHYYVWFPDNFRHGMLRTRLDPPQSPALGFYRSDTPDAATEHIAWCSQYGVDFLTLDWWPGRTQQNAAITTGFLEAPNIADIRFCIFYETWGLGFNKDYGCTEFTPERCDRFVAEMLELTERFFDHPSYLHVQGRPVVVLYLSRTFTGDFEGAIMSYRRAARARGYDPYLVGDEVFWQVSPLVEEGQIPFPLVSEPQPERMACLDAITAYNMYENNHLSQRGYGRDSTFTTDVAAQFDRFRCALPPGRAFVPSVIPGYNDRGVRPSVEHHAIPRQWAPGGAEGSFLAESFERLAFPFVDPELNMILVTSFNEWNEDTAIEPLREAEATTKDISRQPGFYTEGYAYAGHGTRYLEVIRDKVVAVAGQVGDATGAGLPARSVTVIQGRRRRTVQTDSRGYYRVPRGHILPGPCRVRLRATGAVKEGIVGVDRTLLIDF
jgi:glycoprotein endo-alpha-1,2-mannosidase